MMSPLMRARSSASSSSTVPYSWAKYAAAVDIARQQHRRIHQLCKAHVDDIIRLQVDLCRAARAFDHDNVVLGGKAVVGLPRMSGIRLRFILK